MKCNTCQEQQQDSGIVNMLKRTGYPIHNVCISEYFEKVGQKQMDLICATFNSVHMGYMMNLLHYSKDSKNSPNPLEAPPIVVWANSNQEGDMFVLRDSNKETIYNDLYNGLEQVPSEAYCMIVNSTMKMLEKNDVLEEANIDKEEFDKLSKSEKLKIVSDNFNPKDEDIAMKDAVVITGQSVDNNFSYRAIATFSEHNGIKYLTPFKLVDTSSDLDQMPNDKKKQKLDDTIKKVKEVFSSEFFKDIEDKMKDKPEEEPEEDDNPLFGDWKKL